MKSFRLDDETEKKLARAIEEEGISQSEFIRRAINHECDRVFEESLYDEVQDLVGSICAGGGKAEETGEAFEEYLRESSKRK